ncbi:MAG: DUF6268 family outer membrane beta-barrel protein [Bacteroidota bacterium]
MTDADTLFCEPGLRGVPRTKGLVLEREMISNYRIRSTQGQASEEASVNLNRRWNLKARVPIVLKDEIKIAAGFNYSVEEFNFANSDALSFPFYRQLQDRSLKSIGSSLYLIKPFRGKRYFLLRLNGSLNGDFAENSSKSQFFRFAATPLMGWKINEDLAYGGGISLNYNFGRRSLVPIFFIEKNFNRNFGIEALLPLMVRLRYGTLDAKNYFYLKAELNGATYNIDLEEDGSLLFLNKAEIRYVASFEREIHDWLWFSLEAGLRTNFNFDLSNSPRRNAVPVIKNTFNEALVFNFGIFIVPPRKFFD